jgi:hypothetical protein
MARHPYEKKEYNAIATHNYNAFHLGIHKFNRKARGAKKGRVKPTLKPQRFNNKNLWGSCQKQEKHSHWPCSCL